MAIFERVEGPEAVFWVVPLLSGLAVWATYLLGARLAGQATGLGAACLLATSPTFLAHSLVAMSDVPATAWWALSLALLTWDRRDAALAAGLAAGVAVMTRPNLAPLLLVPVLLVVWTGREECGAHGKQRLILLGVGVLPAVVALGLINDHLYGSPFMSGYGSLRELYSWSNLAPNLRRYPAWIVQDTPIIPLALAAPFFFRRPDSRSPIARPRSVAACWLVFAAGVVLSYQFYQPFDSSGYLRFLLPAFPPLLALTAAALSSLMPGRAAPIFTLIVVVAVGLVRLSSARDRGVFDVARGEQANVAMARYIASRLPERAAIISMQQSGSIRYYSGRLTLRYDWILRQRLEWLVGELRRLGYRPYIVLDEWEVPRFRAKFRDHTPLGALDWPPLAQHASGSRIYDPADRAAAIRGASFPTATIR
jgi:4-amino-4-deoxy-L-arabinose transferase-like glycosyltransferase